MRKFDPSDLTGELVARVGFTGEPITFRGWKLDLMNIMRRTTSKDWVGCFMRLVPAAADRIAAELRREMPWAKKVMVYVGEVLPALPPALQLVRAQIPPVDIPPNIAKRLAIVRGD